MCGKRGAWCLSLSRMHQLVFLRLSKCPIVMMSLQLKTADLRPLWIHGSPPQRCRTPPPKRPDCHWVPTRGYPSLWLWNLRCLLLYETQLAVYLPMKPSVHGPLIRGPLLCSTRLFIVFCPLSQSLSTVSAPAHAPVLAVSPSHSLPLLLALYLCIHEYSERRQMSQIHHLRDWV